MQFSCSPFTQHFFAVGLPELHRTSVPLHGSMNCLWIEQKFWWSKYHHCVVVKTDEGSYNSPWTINPPIHGSTPTVHGQKTTSKWVLIGYWNNSCSVLSFFWTVRRWGVFICNGRMCSPSQFYRVENWCERLPSDTSTSCALLISICHSNADISFGYVNCNGWE